MVKTEALDSAKLSARRCQSSLLGIVRGSIVNRLLILTAKMNRTQQPRANQLIPVFEFAGAVRP